MDPFHFLRRIRQSVTPSSPDYRLATVNAYTAGSGVRVVFDGEGADSGQNFPVAGSYCPVIGQRVIMQKIGNTYVVMDSVGMSSNYLIARKTANQSFGSGGHVDVADLSLPMEANARYKVQIDLGVISPSAFTLLLRYIMPAGALWDYGIFSPAPGSTGFDASGRWVYRRSYTSAVFEDNVGGNDVNIDTPVMIVGQILNGSSSGVFKVQGNSATGAGIPWVLQGSTLQLTRMPT